MATLKVFANDQKHGVKYLVPKCPTVFVQTLDNMCLDAEMVHLYKYFVLCGSSLLSTYWREACNNNDNEKEANSVLKDRAFASIV